MSQVDIDNSSSPLRKRTTRRKKGVHKNVKSRKGGAKIPTCAPSAPAVKEKRDKTLDRSDLMNAIFTGDVEWANKLLNGELDIDRQDSDGYSALMLASREGHTDMVRLLLGSPVSYGQFYAKL